MQQKEIISQYSEQIQQLNGIPAQSQDEYQKIAISKYGGLSKSQYKKQIRKQTWEQIKKLKKIKKKELNKQKKAENKINTQSISKQIKQQHQKSQHQIINSKKRKLQYIQKLSQAKLIVSIDLQFYELMVQKQKKSLLKQLAHCHSLNRKFSKSVKLQLNSLSQSLKQEMIKKYNIQNWGLQLQNMGVVQKYQNKIINETKSYKVVYLTGDAQEQLTQLIQNQIYVIGGIVDHNRFKKLTFNFSKQKGISMKRFPIDKHLKLKGNAHLAVNHVFQILLRIYNGQSWAQSLTASIPQRKVAKNNNKQKNQQIIQKTIQKQQQIDSQSQQEILC